MIGYHRKQIRGHPDFWMCGVTDANKLTGWPATGVAHSERSTDRVREELFKRCFAERPRWGTRVPRPAPQVRSRPPSRVRTWPVSQVVPGSASRRIHSASSSGSPRRPSGIC